MRFGIGITTRNRPEVLATTLDHFARFPTEDARYVIVDDNSTPAQSMANFAASTHFGLEYGENVRYSASTERLGIAKAKNACLARLTDCEHVFLFDDDAWPNAQNWAEKWVRPAEYHNVGHTMWQALAGPNGSNIRAKFYINGYVGSRGEPTLVAWDNSMGVVLHFTRECLDALGGFDTEGAKHVYGFEHVQMSLRANRAGFTKGHNFLSPGNCKSLVYSVDVSYKYFNEFPVMPAPWLPDFRSSLTDQEANAFNLNQGLLSRLEVHRPLVDPL
jgi:glycosyltransferase involved in cell wall biosynthesis